MMRLMPPLLAVLGCILCAIPAAAQGTCTKAEFEAVVDDAAAALRTLTRENSPTFQAKLRQLKDKRGWSHEEFLKAAAPLVRDDAIADLDQKSEDLLRAIASKGEAGSAAAVPDCALLGEVRGTMASLVETQKAKWTYMFGKIDAELAR